MNEWKIEYVYNGNRADFIMADTLEKAIQIWRERHMSIPSIALYAIVCVK